MILKKTLWGLNYKYMDLHIDQNKLGNLLSDINCDLVFKEETLSTNEDLKQMKMARGPICEVALSQISGKGSNGRSFISTKGSGIYFSILLKDNNYKYLTPNVSVAIYKSFKKLYNIELSIKWVNDLYYKNKKVCGILCEKNFVDDSVVIGIGINLFRIEDNILKENNLENIAGYIFEKEDEGKIDFEFLIYEIIKNVLSNINKNEIDEVYKNKNLVLNKEVSYKSKKYVAKSINNEGHLIIESGSELIEIASKNDIEIVI